RHREDDLRLLPVGLLELPTNEQIEFLIRAAHFDVRLQGDRVVALYERVQELVDRDRLAALVALAEIVALQHASDGMPCGKLDQTRSAHFVHPAGIELDARALRIEDLEDLLL